MKSNLLKAKIIEKGCSIKEFSKSIDVKSAALYRKFSEKSEFTNSEMKRIADFLHLTNDEIINIFF